MFAGTKESFTPAVILGAAGDDGYKSGQATKNAKKEAKAAEKFTEAEEVLKASVNAPDQGIPRDLLEKAECIGVFPGFKKVALGVGGEGGKGVFTCRTGHGSNMSGPAFFKIGGGSVSRYATKSRTCSAESALPRIVVSTDLRICEARSGTLPFHAYGAVSLTPSSDGTRLGVP